MVIFLPDPAEIKKPAASYLNSHYVKIVEIQGAGIRAGSFDE
jgi:hypothetical protein